MAITYRCDPGLGCTFIMWDREVTPDEWRGHVALLFDDPAFPPGPLVLADLSTAGGAVMISTEVIEEMGDGWSDRAERLDPIKIAVVPNGAWEKARQFERAVEGSGLTTIVFNDLVTACKWLGVDPEPAGSILEQMREGARPSPPVETAS